MTVLSLFITFATFASICLKFLVSFFLSCNYFIGKKQLCLLIFPFMKRFLLLFVCFVLFALLASVYPKCISV